MPKAVKRKASAMPALLETRRLYLKKPAEEQVARALRPTLRARNTGLKPLATKDAAYLLEDLSFSVSAGEVFGIFGPSGSGKSTLLKCLCRLEEATEGEILFHQKPIREYDPRLLRRRLTLVFQTPILLGPSVWDDLLTGFRWKDGPANPTSPEGDRSRNWALRLLSQVHLPERFLGENPKNLSVGETQRVALARALAIQPEILLLDEPTASLDLDSKKKIEETIRELSQNGMTILLVSHDQRQIQGLAQHGLELRDGKSYSAW